MPNPTGKNQYSGGRGKGSKGGSSKGGPSSTNVSTGKSINRVQAAERMFGTGSKQHLAAKKRFG